MADRSTYLTGQSTYRSTGQSTFRLTDRSHEDLGTIPIKSNKYTWNNFLKLMKKNQWIKNQWTVNKSHPVLYFLPPSP